jgi:hypothetical protein
MPDCPSTPALSRPEWKAAWRLMLLFYLLYIHELSHFNVSIDAEFLASSSLCALVEIGRWVPSLLRATLWPAAVTPSGPLLLFGAAFAISFIHAARLFRAGEFGPFHYAAFAAYALFPVWLAQIGFAGNILPDAVGLLAATCAALLTVGAPACGPPRRAWRLAGAAACCAVAVGAYPSLGLMYLALAACAGFAAAIDGPRPAWGQFIRAVARALVALALGFALSLAIGRLFMLGCHAAPSDYGLNILHFGDALRHPLRALAMGVRDVGRLYAGFWRPFGWQVSLTYAVTVLFCCGAIVGLSARGARWRVLAALCVLLLIPASLGIAGAATLPPRTFFAGALVLAFLLLMAHRLCRAPWQRRTVLVLALLCAVQGLSVNSMQQARGWVAARHDLLLAGAIHAEIMRLQDANATGPIYVNFRGKHAFHTPYPILDTAGASFFEWDGGDMRRMVAYMNLIGYDRLRAYPENPPGAFDAPYAQMPDWPAPGSVRRFGNGYLVKLSAGR